MASKIPLHTLLAKLDAKDRNFYDNLTDAERKEFSAYITMRFAASVDADPAKQEWYIRATNEYVNKNLFDISKHPKLQWLTCTTVSLGSHKHYWLNHKKKDSANNKAEKFLARIYPHFKQDEVKLLAEINTKADLKKLAKDMGMSDSDIKKELG